MKFVQHLAVATVACLAVLAAANFASASTYTAPLAWDFSGGTGVSNFTVNSSNTSAVSAVAGTNSLGGACFAFSATKTSAGSMYGWESVQVPNVPSTANSTFTISALISNLSDSDTSNDNATAGIRLLALTNTSNTSSFAVDINDGKVSGNPGKVRLVNWNSSGTATVYPSSTQAYQYAINNWNINDAYLLTVVGTYNSSDQLSIALQVTDENHPGDSSYGYPLTTVTTGATGANGSGGSTLTFSAPSSSQQYFGFYQSVSGSTTPTVTADYTNYSIAVPEPSTFALLAAGFVCLAAFWRRRRTA